ncbi:MAG: hypothetical protein EP330_21470 [Deltaproteobacteria bacterium]|nr:MAG: hypothetical protein EP330_21470 [Deltaproteobacteria bacterium]
MNSRPLLVASALFCSTSALAEPVTPPLDVCIVVTNTKGGPVEEQVPCPEPEPEDTGEDEPVDTASDEPQP